MFFLPLFWVCASYGVFAVVTAQYLYSSQYLQDTQLLRCSRECCGGAIRTACFWETWLLKWQEKKLQAIRDFGSELFLGESSEQGLRRAGLLMCKIKKQKQLGKWERRSQPQGTSLVSPATPSAAVLFRGGGLLFQGGEKRLTRGRRQLTNVEEAVRFHRLKYLLPILVNLLYVCINNTVMQHMKTMTL